MCVCVCVCVRARHEWAGLVSMAMSLLLVVRLLLLLYQLEFFELLCQSNSLFNQLQEQYINQSAMSACDSNRLKLMRVRVYGGETIIKYCTLNRTYPLMGWHNQN